MSNDLSVKQHNWRVVAEDGIAITAQVWNTVHEYHRIAQQRHLAHAHPHGIVNGLNVEIRSAAERDTRDIQINPGLAIDPDGNMIEVTQFHVHNPDSSSLQSNRLYLLLSYRESSPQSDGLESSTGRPVKYIKQQYEIEWTSKKPDANVIELARIQVAPNSRAETFKPTMPVDRKHPMLNELDLRYRSQLYIPQPIFAQVAVIEVGEPSNTARPHPSVAGLYAAVTQANRSGSIRMTADHVDIGADVGDFALVYLIVHDPKALSDSAIAALIGYATRQEGTVFIECQPECVKQTDEIVRRFNQQNTNTVVVGDGHTLLNHPNPFSQPPEGYSATAPKLQMAVGATRTESGLIFSDGNYGLLWKGRQQAGPASREKIRSAHELGENLLAYALRRRSIPIWSEWMEIYVDTGY